MVTLGEAKAHCRILEDEEDALIEGYIASASEHLASLDVDMTGDPLPRPLHHAVLMMVAHFEANREATTSEQARFTPLGVDRLISPYRKVSL